MARDPAIKIRSVCLFVTSADAPCRRVPDHVSVSRIAYFKRKFVEDEDEAPFSFRTYCQTVSNFHTRYCNLSRGQKRLRKMEHLVRRSSVVQDRRSVIFLL